jgi:hypothetical protein
MLPPPVHCHILQMSIYNIKGSIHAPLMVTLLTYPFSSTQNGYKKAPKPSGRNACGLDADAKPRNIVVGGAPGTHLDLAPSPSSNPPGVGTAAVELTQPRVHCIHPASYLNIQKVKWRTEQNQHYNSLA